MIPFSGCLPWRPDHPRTPPRTATPTPLPGPRPGPFAYYAKNRSVPEAGAASHMSPYLHFGQISPVEIALAVRAAKTGDDEDRSAYLEELVVRRELAINHVFHDERYDAYETV